MVNHHRKNFPNVARFVDQVSRGLMISALGLTFKIGDQFEFWRGLEVFQEFGMGG